MTFPQHLRKNLWAVGLVLGLLSLSLIGWRAGAQGGQWRARPHHPERAEARNSGAAQSLTAILNADGTLQRGRNGSFDVSGYRMEYMAGGAPRFVPAGAALGDGWDAQFALPNGAYGELRALAVMGSDIYVGGFFTVAGNVAANNLAKFNTTTNVWSALGSGAGNGVNNGVQTLAVSGSDLYVGGFFTQTNVGGAPVFANYVARFNTSSNTWSALSSSAGDGVNGAVYDLAVSGHNLYVGGSFTQADVGVVPVSANHVAKFNTMTNTWSALGSGAGNGVNGTVAVLAVGGSDLYVGGSFTQANVGGTTVSANNVAKFGTAGNTWSALGSGAGNGVDSGVTALLVSGSDLYVGGYFTQTNVGGAAVSANRVAKFNITTNAWSALGSGAGNGVNSGVFVLLMSGSDLYVGGSFTQADVGGTPVNARHLAKFNAVSGSWSAVGSGAGNGVNGEVYALAAIGSDLYVGGNFTEASVGDAPVSANNVAKFSTTSSTWGVLGAGSGNGLNGYVRALAMIGSDVYVGGSFTVAGNVIAHNVARFNTLTGVWSALGAGAGNGVNSEVTALAVIGSDLYVGGGFTQANLGGAVVSVNRVAKFSTTTNAWSALGAGNGMNGEVYALAVMSSDLYVGGSFSQANHAGAPVSANNVAKFDTTSGAWSALGVEAGNGVDNNVYALAVSGTEIYVGGDFTQASFGDTPVNANYVARFNTTTNTWSALGAGSGNGVDNTVYALAVSGSDLYLGGLFTGANVGDTPVNANYVARFNTTTNAWSALGAGASNGVNNAVTALTTIGSDLYVGGQFNQAEIGGAPVSANHVAKFKTTTNTWSALLDTGGGNGVNGVVQALLVSGSYLYLGGRFTVAGDNKPALNLGRFGVNTAPAISSAPISVVQGSPATSQEFATVSDAEDAENTLVVMATPATGAGVTISGIAVDAAGKVTAHVAASCAATNSTFTLTVADSQGTMATTTLAVNVTANPAPTMGLYLNATIIPGGSTTITPPTAPGDNGTIISVTAAAVGFSGGFSGNTATGALTITNANPPGDYTVNVTVTDDCGATTQRSFTLTVNTAPTINAVAVARQQGSPVSNSQIATVLDAEDAESSLTVTVEGEAMATVNGVTVSSLTVSAAGQVTANVVASCTANNANFALTVTDARGATANATLTVTVTSNAPPTVGAFPNSLVAPGGATMVAPSVAPADNGSIASVTATAAPASFTGTLTGNTATGALAITNANPMGSYAITVTVTDNCGATITQSLTLTVSACGATLSKPGQNFAANGGTGSFTVTIDDACSWTAVSNDPSFITMTAPAGAITGPGSVSYTIAGHTSASPRSGTITVAGQTFIVRQGAQFNDVPIGALFYEEIGKLSAAGITQGCGGGNYCPDAAVTREQMAAFLSRALGVPIPPLPAAQRYADVPPGNLFYAHIEEIAGRQITLGCGNGNYCPTQNATREQMAAFIIRALHAPGYLPPTPAAQRFVDVPLSNPFYAHIEELAVRAITLGCGGGNYCPTANVTRAQMAAFLVRAFGL